MLSLLLTIVNAVWPWALFVAVILFLCAIWFDNETSWGGFRKP